MTARAPVRIDFTGGYTDIPALIQERPGLAVNAAVNLCTTVVGRRRSDGKIRIRAADDSISVTAESSRHLTADGIFDVVKGVIDVLSWDAGIDLVVRSVAPIGTGLGTSAALGVATVRVLTALRGVEMTSQQVVALAADAERQVGIAGGIQDQVAAEYGGFNLIRCSNGDAMVERLCPPRGFLVDLEASMIVAHPGGTRNSGVLVRDVIQRHSKSANQRRQIARLNNLATVIADALDRGDLKELTNAVNMVAQAQQRLHPGVVPAQLRSQLSRLTATGPTVAKLAGGGGLGTCCLFLTAPPQKAILESRLRSLGWQVLAATFVDHGAEVIVGDGSSVIG